MGAPRGRGHQRGLHARAPPAAPGARGGGGWAIFASAEGREVIALSFDDEIEAGEDEGEDEEIDVDELTCVFPNDPKDGTGSRHTIPDEEGLA